MLVLITSMSLGKGHSLELSDLVDMRIIEKVWVIIQSRVRNYNAQYHEQNTRQVEPLHRSTSSRQLEHVSLTFHHHDTTCIP